MSNIEWTDETVNFWTGCEKVSPGCKYCYMYRDMERFRKDPSVVTRTRDATFYRALKWGIPRMIFTNSFSDFFIEHADKCRSDAWGVIERCPQHAWQILTKRPENIGNRLPVDWGMGWDNVWLGVSIENQDTVERAAELIKIQSKIRFISAEPLLEDISGSLEKHLSDIDWVIIGGESGNKTGKYRYRPTQIKWIENLMEACSKNNVAVFLKQTGTYLAQQMELNSRHGRDLSQLPWQMQVREFPLHAPYFKKRREEYLM